MTSPSAMQPGGDPRPKADRVLGLLVRTLGDFRAAAVHFEGVLGFCRRGGYLPELLLECAAAGDPTAADQARAAGLLQEDLRIARTLGVPPHMEQILSRLS